MSGIRRNSVAETKDEDLKDPRVPICLYWDVDKVAEWIEELGFPQYKPCFSKNNINGKRLIRMDASHLPQIGIYDFIHIRSLCKSIRDLLGIEDPDYFRSITLPPREELGMYLELKSQTGKKIDRMHYEKFLELHADVVWQPPLANMCLILPR